MSESKGKRSTKRKKSRKSNSKERKKRSKTSGGEEKEAAHLPTLKEKEEAHQPRTSATETKTEEKVQGQRKERYSFKAKPGRAVGDARGRNAHIYHHGNFPFYYGYRNQMRGRHERVEALKALNFHGKDCLDIGCNIGAVTMQIAQKLHCGSIVGIDLDDSLISKANTALETRREEYRRRLERFNANTSSRGDAEGRAEPPRDWPSAVSFSTQDIMADEPACISETYDVVLCLSVTKWIHLNSGDVGVRKLFQRCFDVLRKGGLFILEPQPWKSYRRNKNITDKSLEYFRNASLKPTQFVDHLLVRVGFSSCTMLGRDVAGGDAGAFAKRPMYVFEKK